MEKNSIISILPLHLLNSILTISMDLIHSSVYLLHHSHSGTTVIPAHMALTATMALMVLSATMTPMVLTDTTDITNIMDITAEKASAISSI